MDTAPPERLRIQYSPKGTLGSEHFTKGQRFEGLCSRVLRFSCVLSRQERRSEVNESLVRRSGGNSREIKAHNPVGG